MLIRALVSNGIFSFLCATLMLVFPAWLSEHIPLNKGDWIGLSVGLLVFVVGLVFLAVRPEQAKKHGLSIVIGDILWVIISSVLLINYLSYISTTGVTLVLMVNLFVSVFAVLQYMGLKQHSASQAHPA